jgi:hypothetical protein
LVIILLLLARPCEIGPMDHVQVIVARDLFHGGQWRVLFFSDSARVRPQFPSSISKVFRVVIVVSLHCSEVKE